jgi:hypothetical protein
MSTQGSGPANTDSETARIETFSDGVFAIAITLLVIEIGVPHLENGPEDTTLFGALIEQWPSYLAYVISFLQIGVVVALFDNDAAGEDARKKLNGTPLSDNVKVLSLPVLEYAKSYPTVGPQGTAEVDVNGCACSLELYFGRDVLEGDVGELAPVEWSSRVRALDRYQGAVVDKAALRSKYLNVLSRAADSSEAWKQHDWEPMERVFAAIFGAFEH